MKFNPKLVSLEWNGMRNGLRTVHSRLFTEYSLGRVSNTLKEWGTVKLNAYPLGTF